MAEKKVYYNEPQRLTRLISANTTPQYIRPSSRSSRSWRWWVYKRSGRDSDESRPLVRGGGYLLFHFRSIIGVMRFNFSVRNGKRWSPHAIATLVSFSACPLPGSLGSVTVDRSVEGVSTLTEAANFEFLYLVVSSSCIL